MRLKADLTLLLVAMLWGSAFVAQRVAAQFHSVYFFNGARFLVAAVLLFPFLPRRRLPARQWAWMAITGTVLFGASALQQAGLVYTTAGNAGFITSLYVIIVPFVLLVGWRERPRATAVLAAGIAAIGAFLLSTAGQFEIKTGDSLELAGAGLWALHVVLLGKFAAAFDTLSFSAGQLAIGSILNLTVSGFAERPVSLAALPLVGPVLYTAVASLALGYTLQLWAQKRTPPTDAAILLSLESVFAFIAAALVLGEGLLPVQLAGCALILAAVMLSQVGGRSTIQSPFASQ